MDDTAAYRKGQEVKLTARLDKFVACQGNVEIETIPKSVTLE
jgi:hypothetical protein